MKIKLLASSLLMAGALIGSGTASAAFLIATGTMTEWQNGTLFANPGVIINPNEIIYTNVIEATIAPPTLSGDLLTLPNAADFITLTFSEVTANLYTMIFNFDTVGVDSPFFNGGGYTTNGGDIEYTLKSLNNNVFNAVKLDSTVAINPTAGITTVNKDVYDLSNNLLVALQSDAGIPDPLLLLAPFTPSQSIFVRDTYNANGGIIASSQNQFSTTVPEPTTIALMGLGLLGFAASRKKKAGLSAMPA